MRYRHIYALALSCGLSIMYPRHAEALIREALRDTRVVAISGPRQSGKTTLARRVATGDFDYLTLDDPSTLEAARADPVGFMRRSTRAVIDEFQRAPALALALKQVVDEDTIPGRFIITGSSDFLAMPRSTESLAGRVESITLLPLSQSEIAQSAIAKPKPPSFIDAAFAGTLPQSRSAFSAPSRDMIAAVLTGGYPEAVARTSERRRRNWHHEYVKAILERDVRDVAAVSRLDLTGAAKFNWDRAQVSPCEDSHATTAPVGSFAANPFGLHDVHGNAWSWVQDCFVDTYKDAPKDGSAAFETKACPRVLRGGSWGIDPRLLRSANRSWLRPVNRFISVGFRLARTLNP